MVAGRNNHAYTERSLQDPSALLLAHRRSTALPYRLMYRATLAALAITLAAATRAAPQGVVLTPPIDLPTEDIVSLKRRLATPNPSGDTTVTTLLYIGRLLGTRQDSLLLEQDADTLAVAARDVMTLLVRHFSETDRRIESGSEVAPFGAAFGALTGWLVGVVARAGGHDARHPVLWGLVAGTTLGFALGAAERDMFAGYSWSPVQVRPTR